MSNMSAPTVPPAISPTGTPYLPPQLVPYLWGAYAVLAAVLGYLAKDAGPLAPYQWWITLAAIILGALLGMGSPGLRQAPPMAAWVLGLALLGLPGAARAHQVGIFDPAPAVTAHAALAEAPASPFTVAPFVGAGPSGLLQGAALTVDLYTLPFAGGHALSLGVLTSASEDWASLVKVPPTSGLGALLGVGLVEQRGWLLSAVAGVQWVDGRASPFGGLAFHFLTPLPG